MLRFVIVIFFLFASCISSFAAEKYAHTAKEEEALFIAKKALDDGFYEVSFNLLQRFIENYSDSPLTKDAQFYIGQSYFYQKKYDEALRQFNALLNAAGTETIRDKLLYWIAEIYFKTNDLSQAYKFYEAIVRGHSSSSYFLLAYYSLGWCLFEQGDYSAAKTAFLQFKNKFPRDMLAEEAAFKAAECLYNLKDYPRLMEYLNGFSRDFPKNTKNALVNFYLAESWFYENKYNEAIAHYNKAISKDTDNNLKNLIYLGLGWCYLKLNNFKDAKTSFENVSESLSDNKNLESLLFGKALNFQSAREYESARLAYAKLINASTDDNILLDAYLGMAEALYNLSDYQGAVGSFQKAESLINKKAYPAYYSERLRYGRALAYSKSDSAGKAKEEFKKLSEDSQDIKMKVLCLTRFAEISQESNEIEGAIAIYERILNEYPDCDNRDYIQYNLTMAYARLKMYSPAIEELKDFIAKFPDSLFLEEANYDLAALYFKNKDYAQSYEQIKKMQAGYPQAKKIKVLTLEGLCLKFLGRFQEALDIFRQVSIEVDSDISSQAKAEFETADCLYELGRSQEALQIFEALRSKYADKEIQNLALWRLAEHYFKTDNTGLCVRYLLGIVNNGYTDSGSLLEDAHYMLGLCYARMGRFNDSTASFLKINERRNIILPKIAFNYKMIGDFQKAIEYYALSLKEDIPNKPEIQFKIGECYEEAGDLNAALAEYAEISGPAEFIVKAFLHCARIYELKEDWPSAIKAYQKIADMNVEEAKFAKERIAVIKEGMVKT